MDIQRLMTAEAKTIMQMFQRYKINARIDKATSFVAETAFLHYGIKLGGGQQFNAIERINRELGAALSTLRRRGGLDEISVILTSHGGFAIETPHPDPKRLNWSGRLMTTCEPHTMLIGESYLGHKAHERVGFEFTPHILLAGTTRSGKTTLLYHMLLSLVANTSPDELRIVLADLKNEELTPFRSLPHVLAFAGTLEAAQAAIAQAVAEKDKRIEHEGYKPFRLLLVVDELAQFAGDKTIIAQLGSLASIGASKLINLILCTQHSTRDGGIGGLMKSNLPLRLVGQVTSGQSYAATGRAELQADMLPGRGSFLRIEGPTVKRFQSFYIDRDDVALMSKKIGAHWSGHAPKTGTIVPKVIQPAPTPRRDDIDILADQVGPLFAQGMKKRQIAREVLQREYAGSYAAKIDAAIQRYQTRLSATTEGATPPLLPATHTSAGETVASSSSDGAKILRLPLRKAS